LLANNHTKFIFEFLKVKARNCETVLSKFHTNELIQVLKVMLQISLHRLTYFSLFMQLHIPMKMTIMQFYSDTHKHRTTSNNILSFGWL